MKRRSLGSLEVSAMGLGCMSMTHSYGKADPVESEATLRRALDIGVTFFDTANAYGLGENERLLGRVLADRRSDIQLSTKFGFVLGDGGPKIDGHPDQVEARCDESLERLGFDAIDLYFLHRPDPEVPIEDTVGAMKQLVEKGKVKNLGLCEVSARSLRKAHAVHPIAAVQSEYSLWTRDPEKHVLSACEELGVGFVPFSPIGRAALTGTIDRSTDFGESGDMRGSMPRFTAENFDKNLILVDELKAVAEAKGVKPGQLALSWLLARGANIVPIPGTKRRAYLEENVAAAEIELDPGLVQELEAVFDPGRVFGARYGQSWMQSKDTDD